MTTNGQKFRCYAPPESWRDGAVALSQTETHHLMHVLRCGLGTEVAVFDGLGRHATGTIVEIEDRSAIVSTDCEVVDAPPPVAIEVVQAIPKKGRMEMILQKATELGAASIQPIMTARTIVKLDPARSDRKYERWNSILIEAAKQCGRSRVPELKQVLDLEGFLQAQTARDLMIICSLEDGALPLKTVVGSVDCDQIETIKILIGPEGDFTGGEYAAATAAGATPVTLGKLVMRTDTATFYMLSILNYLLETKG